MFIKHLGVKHCDRVENIEKNETITYLSQGSHSVEGQIGENERLVSVVVKSMGFVIRQTRAQIQT